MTNKRGGCEIEFLVMWKKCLSVCVCKGCSYMWHNTSTPKTCTHRAAAVGSPPGQHSETLHHTSPPGLPGLRFTEEGTVRSGYEHPFVQVTVPCQQLRFWLLHVLLTPVAQGRHCLGYPGGGRRGQGVGEGKQGLSGTRL